jgi:hypothetical protein
MTERVVNPAEYPAILRQGEVDAARKKAREEQEGHKLDADRWVRYREKVAREEEQRIAALKQEQETIDAMSPHQKARFYARQADRADLLTKAAPHFPPRYQMALDDSRREAAKAQIAERERHEADLGLPKAQADHAARVEEFRRQRLATEAEAEETKRAARVLEREQLEELGEVPTLESLEATV